MKTPLPDSDSQLDGWRQEGVTRLKARQLDDLTIQLFYS
jgi:hypothetical protein